MCGRIHMEATDPEIREIIREMNRSALSARFRSDPDDLLAPEGEIFPSAVLPAAAYSRAGERRIFPMKWGFSLGGRLLINARSETAAEKPSFRDAWMNHRCAVPASWYYEWEHDEKKKPGKKYALRPARSGIIWLAGLYRMEDGLPVMVILTRPAVDALAWMHSRMPLILSAQDAVEWIRPGADPEAVAAKCVTGVRWEQAG